MKCQKRNIEMDRNRDRDDSFEELLEVSQNVAAEYDFRWSHGQ